MKHHFYERNIIDIKNEYTHFLLNILTPLIYEGIKSIYYNAINEEKKILSNNLNIKNPGVTKIFQILLGGIPTLSINNIENETSRIRSGSKCADWFDDLIKSVIKSYIVLLTYNISDKTCKLVDNKYHDKIEITNFIHKCYIECAKIFYNNPELFYHNQNHIILNKNKKYSYKLIKSSILEAIRKILPMKLILTEYLKNDYIIDNNIFENNMNKNNITEDNILENNIINISDNKIKNIKDINKKYSDKFDEKHPNKFDEKCLKSDEKHFNKFDENDINELSNKLDIIKENVKNIDK